MLRAQHTSPPQDATPHAPNQGKACFAIQNTAFRKPFTAL